MNVLEPEEVDGLRLISEDHGRCDIRELEPLGLLLLAEFLARLPARPFAEGVEGLETWARHHLGVTLCPDGVEVVEVLLEPHTLHLKSYSLCACKTDVCDRHPLHLETGDCPFIPIGLDSIPS